MQQGKPWSAEKKTGAHLSARAVTIQHRAENWKKQKKRNGPAVP
jgi:hypothetical protein